MTEKKQELYNGMTAKEKAEELVDKLYQTTPNETWFNPPLGSVSMEYKAWSQAKECALVAVDQMIEWVGDHTYMLGNKERGYHFWREVKEEINKL